MTYKENNIEAKQANGNADLFIVQTAVEKSEIRQVVVYGEDTMIHWYCSVIMLKQKDTMSISHQTNKYL